MNTSKGLICLFFICFNFLIGSLHSQISFSLQTGINYPHISKQESVNEVTFQSYRQIFGTQDLYEVTELVNRERITNSFKNKPGFQVGGNIQFELKNGFGISTGLRILQRNFSFLPESQVTLISSNVIDTVQLTPISGGGGSNCDRTEFNREFPSLEDWNRRKHMHLNLEIPLLVQYTIPRKNIRFEVGGFISTPIFTRIRRWGSEFTREQVGNETVCMIDYSETDNNSANGFSQLNLGIQGGINYALSPKLWLTLGIQQYLGNIFDTSDGNSFSFNGIPSGTVQPLNLNLSIGYHLNNSKEED